MGEYGKPFGVATSGGVVLLGTHVGYGWVLLAGLGVVTVGIMAIRTYFRRNKSINMK